MRSTLLALGLVSIAGLGPPAAAEPRRIPFWPDPVPATLQRRVDGAYALEAVRELGHHHRVQGSPGFRAAAEWVASQIAGATVEQLPADGTTMYAHFRSYLGWTPVSGRLDELAPVPRVLADFSASPVGLADYSQDADVTAELVDVGAGDTAAAYARVEVRGRIVLADGPLPAVHRLAVEQRGALGIVSDFPNQRTAWSGANPDLVRWGHLSPYQTRNRFAFMVSPRAAASLRAELAKGPVRIAAHVRGKMVPASFDIVSAVLPGTDASAGEIVVSAHLCHEARGANDDASGSAVAIAVARGLQAAIAAGELPPPRRSIRFLWVPEIAGSQAWLVRHPELAARMRAGIHLDMVGGRPEVTHAALHVSRTAGSLPHVANEIARAWVDDVARASTRLAEAGEGDGLVWPGGGRDALVPDFRPLEVGSDHQVFAAFGVPMVYFHDWPDVTVHTDHDVPENLDPTKLGRVGYMTAGIAWTLAALPETESVRLAGLERAATEARLAEVRHTALAHGLSARDAQLAEREAVLTGAQALGSVAALWPGAAAEVSRQRARLPRTPAVGAGPARDVRVPVRTPTVRGPVDVYYFDYLAAVLGDARGPPPALERRDPVLALEALNLVDGHRSVSDIRDVLTGRYAPVPLDEVAAYLALLARAGVVRLPGAPGPADSAARGGSR